jgi:hypothetical protein
MLIVVRYAENSRLDHLTDLGRKLFPPHKFRRSYSECPAIHKQTRIRLTSRRDMTSSTILHYTRQCSVVVFPLQSMSVNFVRLLVWTNLISNTSRPIFPLIMFHDLPQIFSHVFLTFLPQCVSQSISFDLYLAFGVVGTFHTPRGCSIVPQKI